MLDSEEVQIGSDPTNENDTFPSVGSFDATEAAQVPLVFTVGDPSGSHSEQWELLIYEVADDGTESLQGQITADLGVLASRQIGFAEGFRQRIRLNHVRGEGDFDYTFKVELADNASDSIGAVIDDPLGLLGEISDASFNDLSGSVDLTVPKRTLKSNLGDSLIMNLASPEEPGEDPIVQKRYAVFFDAAPLSGNGNFILKQSNDKIKIWTAETGGIQLTGPGSLTKVWATDNSELLLLSDQNMIWVEPLEASDEFADVVISLEFIDIDGQIVGKVTELEVTIFNVQFDEYVSQVEPKPNGYLANHIGRRPFNRGSFGGLHEVSTLIKWNLNCPFVSEVISDFSSKIISISEVPLKSLDEDATLDDVEFKASNGVLPIRFIADRESQSDKCNENNPVGGRTFEVGIFYRNQLLETVQTIVVFSRHEYLWRKSIPIEERFDRTVAYNSAKFVGYDYPLLYDPDLDGATGLTVAYNIPPFKRVFVATETLSDENFLASTRIHEDVHYEQGRLTIVHATDGRTIFFSLADIETFSDIDDTLLNSLDLSSTTSTNRAFIRTWAEAEIEAYLNQLADNTAGVTCLRPDQVSGREDSMNTYIKIFGFS